MGIWRGKVQVLRAEYRRPVRILARRMKSMFEIFGEAILCGGGIFQALYILQSNRSEHFGGK